MEQGAPEHAVRYFEVQLLAFTGFDLQLEGCAVCGGGLPGSDVLFSPAAGGFACPRCRGEAGSGRLLSLRAARVLRFARAATLDAFAAVRLDPALAREVELATGDAVRFVLEREPATARYIDEVDRILHPG
jgi:DNA repair protein RecO (recombination protein O)